MTRIGLVLAFVIGLWVGSYYFRAFYWHQQWYHGFTVGAVAALLLVGVLRIFEK